MDGFESLLTGFEDNEWFLPIKETSKFIYEKFEWYLPDMSSNNGVSISKTCDMKIKNNVSPESNFREKVGVFHYI